MRARNFIGLFLMAQFVGPGLLAQTPDVMRKYIRDNIEVYYLPEPNSKVDYRQISLVNLIETGTNFIFGKISNSGMDESARLIDALIKSKSTDPSKSMTKSANPDEKFQETIYYALKLGTKKVKLFFINDKNGVGDKWLSEYNFYYFKTILGDNVVWPGAFKDPTTGSAYAGSIVIGEGKIQYSTAAKNKQLMISLIAQLSLGDFGPFHLPEVYDMSYKSGTKKTCNPVSDTRRIENQAIADAFLLYYSDNLKQLAFDWASSGGGANILLPVSEVDLGLKLSDEEGTPPTPQRYSLRDRYISIDPGLVGEKISATLMVLVAVDNWRFYNISDYKFRSDDNMNYFLYQLELYQAIYIYQFVRAFGIAKFVDCLAYDKKRLLKIKPGQKLAFLIQNMALLMLNGKTARYVKDNPGSKEATNSVLPLAMFSYLGGLGFKNTDDAAFLQAIKTVSGAVSLESRPEFDELVKQYTGYWVPVIKEKMGATNPGDFDDGYIFGGPAAIARILGIN